MNYFGRLSGGAQEAILKHFAGESFVGALLAHEPRARRGLGDTSCLRPLVHGERRGFDWPGAVNARN